MIYNGVCRWWVASHCFTLSLVRNKKLKIGWGVKAVFSIGLYQKDLALLEQIKSFFGVGSIHKQGLLSIQYHVTSVKDLSIIIMHFDKYPLIT